MENKQILTVFFFCEMIVEFLTAISSAASHSRANWVKNSVTKFPKWSNNLKTENRWTKFNFFTLLFTTCPRSSLFYAMRLTDIPTLHAIHFRFYSIFVLNSCKKFS